MMKRFLVVTGLFVVSMVLCLPTFAQKNAEQAPVFTYVAEWGVPRAQWGEMEKPNPAVNSLLESLVADGTITGYGRYENLIHSVNGMTHGNWFQANSVAGILKALAKIYALPAAVNQPVQAESKHQDYLMVSDLYGSTPVSNATGYLRVISAQLKPGKVEQFYETFRRYMLPVYKKLLADGVIVSYQLDTEYNIENAPGRFFAVTMTRNAEDQDKIRMAIGELFEKNPAVLDELISTTVVNSRNDFLARVTSMTHK